jgi:hypothetical protein
MVAGGSLDRSRLRPSLVHPSGGVLTVSALITQGPLWFDPRVGGQATPHAWV